MNKNLLRKLDLFSPVPGDNKNQYKRQDVFRCKHEAHNRFDSVVSVYHVLKEKECYPEGCIYFKWKCKLLDKGSICPRKYKHVGRACSSCRNFYDIKVFKKPEVILAKENFTNFQKDLKEFESWLMRNMGKLVEFSGSINSVKPGLSLEAGSKKYRLIFNGFLLNFLECWINSTHFQDFIYVPISSRQQGRFGFAKGDEVLFRGYFTVMDGSVVIRSIKSVEIIERGEPCFWTESRARVAQRTGSVLIHQEEKCYSCDKGILLNVGSDDLSVKGPRRMMFCLEGVQDSKLCCYALKKNLKLNGMIFSDSQ